MRCYVQKGEMVFIKYWPGVVIIPRVLQCMCDLSLLLKPTNIFQSSETKNFMSFPWLMSDPTEI